MKPAQQELFDRAILRVLDANRSRFGLGAEAVAHLMLPFGFPGAAPDDVLERLAYLTAKGLVEEVKKAIGNANRAWRATSAGLQFVDEQG